MVVGFYKKLRWVAREFLSFLAPSSQWQSVATALLFQYLQKRVPQNDNKKANKLCSMVMPKQLLAIIISHREVARGLQKI